MDLVFGFGVLDGGIAWHSNTSWLLSIFWIYQKSLLDCTRCSFCLNFILICQIASDWMDQIWGLGVSFALDRSLGWLDHFQDHYQCRPQPRNQCHWVVPRLPQQKTKSRSLFHRFYLFNDPDYQYQNSSIPSNWIYHLAQSCHFGSGFLQPLFDFSTKLVIWLKQSGLQHCPFLNLSSLAQNQRHLSARRFPFGTSVWISKILTCCDLNKHHWIQRVSQQNHYRITDDPCWRCCWNRVCSIWVACSVCGSKPSSEQSQRSRRCQSLTKLGRLAHH